MANDMIVDIYCHIMPEKFSEEMSRIAPRLGNIAARLRGVKKLLDLDERFREMDQFGDYREIVSLPNPPIEDLAAGDVGLALARIGNDAMAELCARHPQRFPTFVAAVSMTDVDGSVKEARRAVTELGAGGVQIFTSVVVRPLDDPRLRADLCDHGGVQSSDLAASGAHCQHDGLPGGAEVPVRDVVAFGWPYDTSVAMVRMVFAGLLDRYPGLKIITHHLGGMIPYYDGRIGPGLQVLGSRTSDEDYSNILPSLKRPHLDYLHDFYGDTALFGGGIQAVRCGLEFFGSDHVVFATDILARSDRADHRYDQAAGHRGQRSTQDFRRQCRAASENETVLTGRRAPCR